MHLSLRGGAKAIYTCAMLEIATATRSPRNDNMLFVLCVSVVKILVLTPAPIFKLYIVKTGKLYLTIAMLEIGAGLIVWLKIRFFNYQLSIINWGIE